MSDLGFAAIAEKYARDVVDGVQPACQLTIRACARHLEDLDRTEVDPAWPYRFDADAANRVCRFIELMPHVKGKWARRQRNDPKAHLIRLQPWQVFILAVVFGWRHRESGLRRFRTVYIEVPRKNAKSTLTAPVALYMMAADEEEGAECYSAATTRDQAKIVFSIAKKMVDKTPGFRSRFGVESLTHNVSQPGSFSSFQPLSAEGSNLDGLNTHFAAIDELHAHKNRSVFDVIETSTGARDQSLLWSITTSGSNQAGICYEQRSYVTKILNRVIEDETYFGIIYTIDDDDDWFDPKSWAKANPNLGVSVFADQLARLASKAKQSPASLNNFKTKHLDVWVNADSAWMNPIAWAAQGNTALRREDFAGQEVISGLDLASKVDIASRADVFMDTVAGVPNYYAFLRHYLPEDRVADGVNDLYSGWVKEEWLTATSGNVIDIDLIERDILDFADGYDLREIAYDPHQATQLVNRLTERNLQMVEVRPTVLNFSEPMKELEKLVLGGTFHHAGDPVMTWMVSNVVCHYDQKDNIYPRKERPENKIDGVVATIMAIARWQLDETEQPIVYERGAMFA